MDSSVNEALHKEIDLIQACINRMADCSFKLKGWYISLVTVSLTLLIGQGCKLSIISMLLLGITTVFWWLDGYFLKMETLYRWKYEWLITERLKGNVDNLYDLNPYNKEMWKDKDNKNTCIMKYIVSKTLCPIYGIIWLIAMGMMVFIIFNY